MLLPKLQVAPVGLLLVPALVPQYLPQGPRAPFIKGWVIIETDDKDQLDVTAAYSAHGFRDPNQLDFRPQGFALDIESIVPTRVK